MVLHKSVIDLLRSKESSLKSTEVRLKAAIAESKKRESETALLLGKIADLEEKLRAKTLQVEQLELKRVENDGSYRKLVEQVEWLACELQAEKMKRNRLNEAYKSLKSQHMFLRQKFGLTEENRLPQKSESGLAKHHDSPITEPAGINKCKVLNYCRGL